jgi:hypothetical protein
MAEIPDLREDKCVSTRIESLLNMGSVSSCHPVEHVKPECSGEPDERIECLMSERSMLAVDEQCIETHGGQGFAHPWTGCL